MRNVLWVYLYDIGTAFNEDETYRISIKNDEKLVKIFRKLGADFSFIFTDLDYWNDNENSFTNAIRNSREFILTMYDKNEDWNRTHIKELRYRYDVNHQITLFPSMRVVPEGELWVKH
jgi:hypothetical protein